MFETILILLFFAIFVRQKFSHVKVSAVKNQAKRKYVFDPFDLNDEPPAKRPRMEEIKVMRVFPYHHYEQCINQNEDNDSDDETIFSETTMDSSEYFARDPQPHVLVSTQTVPIPSDSSSEGEYDLEDRLSGPSVSSFSLSLSSVSLPSTLEFNEENLLSSNCRPVYTPRSDGNFESLFVYIWCVLINTRMHGRRIVGKRIMCVRAHVYIYLLCFEC